MKLMTILLAGAIVVVGAEYARAHDPQAEQTIIANERAVNDAVAKANVAGFTQHVTADGWAVDGMSGRMAVADFIKGFDVNRVDEEERQVAGSVPPGVREHAATEAVRQPRLSG
jgi:hypothetical protein